ncbi:MAG TPA: hypothetical protein VEW25_07015, partial [Allosphingosinicella sp.]|nr:hypothetical protein [Allosphingosinicella sp.]
MPRPFTRRQAQENARFLDALRRTGNARLAARSLGVHRATYTKRRARSAAFATDWDSACAAAHAAFHLSGGARPPESKKGTVTSDCPPSLRTSGGEPHVVRLRNGRLQLRLAPPGRITKAAEQLFFSALSASANIRLSAAAAGFAHSSFYRRRRVSVAFAREMRLSLETGYDRLEWSAIAAALPESWADDSWREGDLPPLVPMSFGQTLQLLALHEKPVRQGWDMPHRKRRRGEPWETYTLRLRAMWKNEQDRAREDEALRRAARYEETGSWRHEDEAPPPDLPPLALVTARLDSAWQSRAWSKGAKVEVVHNPDLA